MTDHSESTFDAAASDPVLTDAGGNPLPYADAVAELEAILASLEASSVDIDALATQVARATRLIDHCRHRLVAVRSQVDRVLADAPPSGIGTDADD